MNIYDRLRQFQTIPDAYNHWKAYRKEMADYVVASADKDSTLLVVGAGACNDIDLGRLSSHFSNITLSDRDIESVKLAFHRYDKLDNINVIEQDYVGISDDMYRMLADNLRYEAINSNGKYQQFSEKALGLYKDLFLNIYNSIPIEEKYDYVLCAGVHSQLISMCAWIWQAFAESLQIDDNSIFDFIKQINKDVIKCFDDFLFGSFRKQLFISIENNRFGDDSPIEGAYQGILDIKSRAKAIDMKPIRWMFSPDNGIIYEMNFYKIQS